MAGPSVEEIQTALDVYKQARADVDTKRDDRNAKFATMQTAETDFEVAQNAYTASVQASIDAEAELQRLIDEHTPDGAETPPGP